MTPMQIYFPASKGPYRKCDVWQDVRTRAWHLTANTYAVINEQHSKKKQKSSSITPDKALVMS